jgi:hypothetical protein
VLAIFWLGMFTTRANSLSALVAGIVGTLLGLYIAFWTDLSFLWPAVFAFSSAMAVGYIIGLFAKPTEAAKQWNWFAITKQPLQE